MTKINLNYKNIHNLLIFIVTLIFIHSKYSIIFTRLKMWNMCLNSYIKGKSKKLTHFAHIFYFWQVQLNFLPLIRLFHQFKTFSSKNSPNVPCSVDHILYQVIIFVDVYSGSFNLSLQVFTRFRTQLLKSLEGRCVCFSCFLLFIRFFCWTFFWWISA